MTCSGARMATVEICGKMTKGRWKLDFYRPGVAPCQLPPGHDGPCNPDADPVIASRPELCHRPVGWRDRVGWEELPCLLPYGHEGDCMPFPSDPSTNQSKERT